MIEINYNFEPIMAIPLALDYLAKNHAISIKRSTLQRWCRKGKLRAEKRYNEWYLAPVTVHQFAHQFQGLDKGGRPKEV